MASGTVDQLEADLVGQIVADEDRRAPVKRGFSEKLRDCHAFVLSGGSQFDDHLSELYLEFATELAGQPAHRILGLPTQLRNGPEMKGEIDALVLEHKRGMSCGHDAEPSSRFLQRSARDHVSVHCAGKVAALGAVLPGDAESGIREQAVDVGDRASADQRQGAVRSPAERLQQKHQIAVDADESRVIGDIEERSVDVEEERALPLERGRLLESRLGHQHRPGGQTARMATGLRSPFRESRRLRMRIWPASSSIRPAQRYTLKSWISLRMLRIRSRCSAGGIISAALSAAAH